MMIFVLILCFASCDSSPITEAVSNVTETPTPEPNITLTTTSYPNILYTKTRRILKGTEAFDTRPYMVYLRAASAIDAQTRQTDAKDTYWLCGGVIIDPSFILTSAACIEDVKNFYIISGTHSWNARASDCVRNGKKKAVWKCTMESYNFDGYAFDNIQWMEADIAVVKVESPFLCNKRIKGCDFTPEVVKYNNDSEKLERPGSVGSTAGWGSTLRYQDANDFDPMDPAEVSKSVSRFAENEPELLEADVVVMNKDKCKKLWPERYHSIIDTSMICTKDITGAAGGTACSDQGVKCVDMTNPAVYDEYSAEELLRSRGSRKQQEPLNITRRGAIAHSYMDHKSLRRVNSLAYGGFCENDHGGPLINGHGRTSIAIGIISACQSKPGSLECIGPFLYTSIYKYRNLIRCAIQDSASFPHEVSLLRWANADLIIGYYVSGRKPRIVDSRIPTRVQRLALFTTKNCVSVVDKDPYTLIREYAQPLHIKTGCTRRGDHKSILRETFYKWPPEVPKKR